MSKLNEFQLGIRFPNKFDEKYKLGYIFLSGDVEREDYIRKEYDYCKNEEKSYLTALYSNQRISAVQNLYNKRIEFAKKNGFKITMDKS